MNRTSTFKWKSCTMHKSKDMTKGFALAVVYNEIYPSDADKLIYGFAN